MVSPRDLVEFARRGPALAVLDRGDAGKTLAEVHHWLETPDLALRVDTGAALAVLRQVLVIAERRVEPDEAIERHRQPLAATRRGLGCGTCNWCINHKCTVDPPMMWRGESAYLPMRPDVEDDLPACSRWEKREGE